MARQYYRNFPVAFIVVLTLVSVRAGAEPATEGLIPETGLRYWEWDSQGVLFRLTQRLPDQTRAFFLARGFDTATADSVATQCVFQSKFQNTGDTGRGAVDIDLDEWTVLSDGQRSGLLTRQKWMKKLKSAGVSPAALIAFEWSLLPTRQSYAPDDYNWGMTSYGLKPGARFDLRFTWHRNGRQFEGVLRNVDCPADIHPEPDAGK